MGGGVVGLVSRLDAAFRHHCVGVAHPQLGDDHDVRAAVICFNGSRSAGAAAADNEDVDVIVRVRKVDLLGVDAGVRLEDRRQLQSGPSRPCWGRSRGMANSPSL